MKCREKVFSEIALLSLTVAFIIFTSATTGAAAEKYPSKDISIIVPYAAGSTTDLSARVFAEFFRKEIGVPVIVDVRPESGGIKGVLDVYKAKPDGYTLLATLLPRQPYTEIAFHPPFKILDFTYIAGSHRYYTFVAVNKDSPYKTLKDLLEASKKKSINCSTPGMGSRSHLEALILKKKVGINLEPVPFKGAAPAMMALLGGNVDLIVVDDLALLGQKGKVRELAIFSGSRAKKFPDVPTFKELGFDLPIMQGAQGISGPPGLPNEISKILSDASAKAIRNPEFISKMDKLGPAPHYMTGPEFRAAASDVYEALKKVTEEYKDLIKQK